MHAAAVFLVSAMLLTGLIDVPGLGSPAMSAEPVASGIGSSGCVKTADGLAFRTGVPMTSCEVGGDGGGESLGSPPAGEPGRFAAGADPVGTTNYPVPADALFVAPAGSDNGPGSITSPFATVGKAIGAASAGRTIVLRAGSYHEAVVVPSTKSLTIQSYPDEAVWFEGSSPILGWERSTYGWVHSGWTTEFDSSPTYTFGARDGTAPGWSFVNPARPMAAHPDQVWVAGAPQEQVATLGELRPGAFYVDYATDQLHLGSDPQSGEVRASDLARAIAIRGAGSILRGVGVRRFAPSVPHMGAVTLERDGITIENVHIADNSTTGLFVMGTGSRVIDVTVANNGMLGASASMADQLVVRGMAASGNNTQGFNNSPVSGGLKVARSRSVEVSNSSFRNNAGPGLWFDESVYNGTVVRNDVLSNSGHGIIVEISARFLLADNVVMRNRDNGLKLNDSSELKVWNNTLVANGRPVNIVQDSRRASNLTTPGHDPRQAQPDPTMTWVVSSVEVKNNVIDGTTGNCILCVEDYSRQFSAEQMGVTLAGNVFIRESASQPAWLIVWSRGPLNPAVYPNLADFTRGTGIAQAGIELRGTLTEPNGDLSTLVRSQTSAIAAVPPLEISAATGHFERIPHLGAWF